MFYKIMWKRALKLSVPNEMRKLTYKNMSAFFLETSISENVGGFKGKRVHFNVMVIENKTFFPIIYAYQGQKN